MKGWFWLH